MSGPAPAPGFCECGFWKTGPHAYGCTQPAKDALAKERRERIATTVLAGFAHDDRALNYFEANARYAIASADALIAELDAPAKAGR